MTLRHRLAGAALACLLALCSCSSSKPASPYSSADRLARALNAGGVACTGVAPTKGGRATEGAAAPLQKGARPLIEQAAACSHRGSKLLLFTFKTAALRDRWLALGRLYGSVVVGPNWTVSAPSKDVAKQISDALGGEVR